ncbi:phosphotransferase [Streptomyces sp. NPDC005955]|uniref:phosphotransferase enzyme family protein n=1 Tax=Streptomyces sp. NPDC005955 TaxID=3364738 RepID=UPI0036C2AF66
MHDLPADVSEAELREALLKWGVRSVSLAYAPVGFGDYHWSARDDEGRRWFLTVADLANKPYCGEGTTAAHAGLLAAMDTAGALSAAGLDPVLAPLPTLDGARLHRLGERYALSVQPWVDAPSGAFGQRLTARERADVMRVLASLHRSAPPAPAPVLPPGLPGRRRLEAVLRGADDGWADGPFAGPARELLQERAAGLRDRLEEFDRRVAALPTGAGALVVTHGEPHPGNLLWGPDGGFRLVDWDTCGLAVPERDLWHVALREDGGFDAEALSVWAEESGRTPDPSALEFYRLRWDLDDLCAFLDVFRAPHGRSADTEASWGWLRETVARLVDGGR